MTSSFPPLTENDHSMDLMRDLGAMCRSELAGMGYMNVSAGTPEEMCERYLNALYRRVPARKRTFHQSKQLRVPADLQAGFELLKKRVEDGDDLTAHLSGLVDNVDYNDPLLNTWKIHHFHLGTQAHKSKPHLIERTGPILLAMVQEVDFYGIAILPHGKGGRHDLFYDLDLIEILHENFPAMMSRYKINGWAATPKPTNDEIKLARDNGITVFAQTNDGTLYLPTAGVTSAGGTTANTGGQIVLDAMRVVRGIKLLEKVVAEKLGALEVCFSKSGGKRPYKIVLTGFLNNGYVTAREESSYVGMRISLFKGAPGAAWLDIWHEAKP